MLHTDRDHRPDAIDPARRQQLERLRARLAAEADRAGREDLVQLLDERPAGTDAPIRACFVGTTKVGKSRLLNAVVGHPLLSPVGVDITTSCWLEVGYGESTTAEVVMADPDSPAHPVSRWCGLGDVERYVALGRSREPVLGVKVRLPEPALRNLLIVDTPGVNGLVHGHTATTLAALRTADALLFVCDSRQPILKPELDFLIEAARRVPTVVVAMTKRDLSPSYARIVEDTRARIAATGTLRDVPVLAVAAPLADMAAETSDQGRAGQLRDLSGVEPLLTALRRYSTTGAEQVRFHNAARVLAEVCRALAAQTQEIVDILAGNAQRGTRLHQEIEELQDAVDHSARLARQVRDRLDDIRGEQVSAFGNAVEALRTRHRATAEWGPPAQLATLADQLTSEISAAAVEALENTTRGCTVAVGKLMGEHGGGDRWPTTPATASARFAIGLAPPDVARARSGVDLMASAEMFAKVVEILAGPVAVLSVLTGPGVIAVGLALAAGAGIMKSGGGEQEGRSALLSWVERAADQAQASFRSEVDDRVGRAERYLETALPQVLDARRRRLDQLANELRFIKSSTADLRVVLAEREAAATAVTEIEQEVDELVAWAGARGGGGIR
jgi:Dynamin family